MRRPPVASVLPLRSHRRRAAAAVEFALIAPVFVTMIVGALDSLSALHTLSLMTQAIREGGRLGAGDWTGVPQGGGTPTEKVARDVTNFLRAGGVDTTGLQVTVTYAEGASAGDDFPLAQPEGFLQLFRIQAHLPHRPGSFYSSWLTQGRGLSARAVFRAGQAQVRD